MYIKARITSATGTIYQVEYGAGFYSKTGLPRWHTRSFLNSPASLFEKQWGPRTKIVAFHAAARRKKMAAAK